MVDQKGKCWSYVIVIHVTFTLPLPPPPPFPLPLPLPLSRFGYIEFSTCAQAKKALASLNGQELEGRELRVDVAESRGSGGGRGGGGGRGSGFGGVRGRGRGRGGTPRGEC